METLNKIVNILKEKSIEQKALTEYLGITAQVFTDWKGGRNSSYLKYIDRIADYLNVSTDYLLDKDDIKKRPTSEEIGRIQTAMANSEIIKDFVERYMALSPADQKKMEDMLDLITRANEHK